jgi:hypothetical protein
VPELTLYGATSLGTFNDDSFAAEESGAEAKWQQDSEAREF